MESCELIDGGRSMLTLTPKKISVISSGASGGVMEDVGNTDRLLL
jgi:hypothetical protein